VISPEFGVDAGKRVVMVWALYGLKSVNVAFRNHSVECMAHLRWTYCHADWDLWMKNELRPDDGVQYWAYILIYADDILCVRHEPGVQLTKLDQYFKMKNGSIQEPTFYLGAKLRKTTLLNDVIAWRMSSSKYVQSTIQNVQHYLVVSAGGQKLKTKASVHLPIGLMS
jgi:hypothetical protein